MQYSTKTLNLLVLLAILIPVLGESSAATTHDQKSPSYTLRAVAELGTLDVLRHHIQFSQDGTRFDYVNEGGQDVLYPFARLSLDLGFASGHGLTFLYQTLTLNTRTLYRRDVRIDKLTFPSGTPVAMLYNFPFTRISYLYDFADAPDEELAFGASLQIRNATIEFASLDGTLFRSNRNVGPVPLLKFRWRRSFSNGFWLGVEADGAYAPISYLNGSENETTGALLDASLRMGLVFPGDTEGFVNLRYVGGGAEGTSLSEQDLGDGYVDNWLHFFIMTVGFSYTLH